MAVLRMLAFTAAPVVAPAQQSAPAVLQAPVSSPAPVAATKPSPAPAPVVSDANIPEWRDMLGKLGLNGMAYALASNCILESITGNKAVLSLAKTHEPMLNAKLKDRIAEAIGRFLNRVIQLDIKITAAAIETPTKQAQDERNQRLTTAKKETLSDPRVQALIDMYDASVEVDLAST